jgi:CheY-like chemotaxis protein
MATEQRMQTVLLVDDEPSVLLVMRRLLEGHGYKVFHATSGREALEIWNAHQDEIDLLFTDLQMPEMNGSELAGRLRSLRPDLKILFTSGSGISVVEAMLATWHWRDRFVPKPYKPGALIEAVQGALADDG